MHMFTLGGNDNFGDRFDSFVWSAPFYQTPDEAAEALQRSGVIGKQLLTIHAIGLHLDAGDICDGILYDRLEQAGLLPFDGNDDDRFLSHIPQHPAVGKVRVPRSVELCEPVQFVFSDGTSLELLPLPGGGARIGINTIPPGLVNGLNDSTFRSDLFFRELSGGVLCTFTFTKSTSCITQLHADRRYSRETTDHVLRMDFSDPYFHLELCSLGGRYRLQAADSVLYDTLPYEQAALCLQENEQIPIMEGPGEGGVFQMYPVSLSPEADAGTPRSSRFTVGVNDHILYGCIGHLLQKYYDPALQVKKDRYDENLSRFDWYGANYYSIPHMKAMIGDMRLEADKLRCAADGDASENTAAADLCLRLSRRFASLTDLPGFDAFCFSGP